MLVKKCFIINCFKRIIHISRINAYYIFLHFNFHCGNSNEPIFRKKKLCSRSVYSTRLFYFHNPWMRFLADSIILLKANHHENIKHNVNSFYVDNSSITLFIKIVVYLSHVPKCIAQDHNMYRTSVNNTFPQYVDWLWFQFNCRYPYNKNNNCAFKLQDIIALLSARVVSLDITKLFTLH